MFRNILHIYGEPLSGRGLGQQIGVLTIVRSRCADLQFAEEELPKLSVLPVCRIPRLSGKNFCSKDFQQRLLVEKECKGAKCRDRPTARLVRITRSLDSVIRPGRAVGGFTRSAGVIDRRCHSNNLCVDIVFYKPNHRQPTSQALCKCGGTIGTTRCSRSVLGYFS